MGDNTAENKFIDARKTKHQFKHFRKENDCRLKTVAARGHGMSKSLNLFLQSKMTKDFFIKSRRFMEIEDEIRNGHF